jgi:hypothetical protein
MTPEDSLPYWQNPFIGFCSKPFKYIHFTSKWPHVHLFAYMCHRIRPVLRNCVPFIKRTIFGCQLHPQPQIWTTTPFWLYVSAYSIHSQLHSDRKLCTHHGVLAGLCNVTSGGSWVKIRKLGSATPVGEVPSLVTSVVSTQRFLANARCIIIRLHKPLINRICAFIAVRPFVSSNFCCGYCHDYYCCLTED